MTTKTRPKTVGEEAEESTGNPTNTKGSSMRVIVPLQGVVQGRGGLVLGSLIPCALYYFLQLYLKRRRPHPPPSSPPPQFSDSPAGLLPRTLLSPRGIGGPAHVSGRAGAISKGGDSPYFVGLRRAEDDPYDEVGNPDGVVQLGLAENKVSFSCLLCRLIRIVCVVCFLVLNGVVCVCLFFLFFSFFLQLSLDLVRDWLVENARDAMLSGGGNVPVLSISGIASYHPFDGLMDLKVVC